MKKPSGKPSKKQPSSSLGRAIYRLLHSVLFTANIGVVLLLLLTGYGHVFDPSKTPLLPLLSYGFPLVALANLVFVLYWLIRFKGWILLSLVGILLTWGAHRAWFPLNTGKETSVEKNVKVLTFNVMNLDFVKDSDGSGLHPVVTYIAESGADIVCMQEVGEGFVRHRLKNKQTKKALKAYPYVVSGASEGRYSVVCLSKYPILSKHRIDYESQSNSSFRYDILVDADTLTVINNHLESNKLNPMEKDRYSKLITNTETEEITHVARMLGSKVGNATSIRAAQARAVADEIKQCTHPVIVCGDFNDVPGSYVYRTISKGLRDVWVEQGRGWGHTFHESFFLFRIDYILHSPDITIVDVGLDKVKISDHYPLTATLTL